MIKVLIFEPHAIGHRAVFVRYLMESIERHVGLQATWVVEQRERGHPDVVAQENQFKGLLRVVAIELPWAGTGLLNRVHPLVDRQFRYMKTLRRFIESQPQGAFDYIFIPFLDDCGLVPLTVWRRPFGDVPWGGIVIRPRYHMSSAGLAPRRIVDIVERFIYSMLFRHRGDLRDIFTIDQYFQASCSSPNLHYVSDPARMATPCVMHGLERIESSKGDVAILVYGYLDQRKGIPELLAALSDDRVPNQLKLLLVGAQHEDIRALLDQPIAQRLRADGRLVEINRQVSDEEEAAAFHAADVVWCFYPGNYGPSGVLVRAGQASKPVICTREGYCGRVVAETGMGLAPGERSIEGVIQALRILAADRKKRHSMGAAGFARFSDSTPAAFADPIVAGFMRTAAAPSAVLTAR